MFSIQLCLVIVICLGHFNFICFSTLKRYTSHINKKNTHHDKELVCLTLLEVKYYIDNIYWKKHIASNQILWCRGITPLKVEVAIPGCHLLMFLLDIGPSLRLGLLNPMYFICVNLSEDEAAVIRQVNQPILYGLDWRRSSAVHPVRELLGCGIYRLPTTVTGRQIGACHPNIVPHVEIPFLWYKCLRNIQLLNEYTVVDTPNVCIRTDLE